MLFTRDFQLGFSHSLPAPPGQYTLKQIRETIEYLKTCRKLRAEGVRVACITDPAWLVDMAINRRAGWPDDPGHTRGSAMPLKRFAPGFMTHPIYQYPPKASGDGPLHDLYGHLGNKINTRCVVRVSELGSARKYLLARIPHRFTFPGDE